MKTLPISWIWTIKNIPNRQQCVHFRKSQKVVNHSLTHSLTLVSTVRTRPLYLALFWTRLKIFKFWRRTNSCSLFRDFVYGITHSERDLLPHIKRTEIPSTLPIPLVVYWQLLIPIFASSIPYRYVHIGSVLYWIIRNGRYSHIWLLY